MARVVTGVDIGLRTAKFLRGRWKGNTLEVLDFAATPDVETPALGQLIGVRPLRYQVYPQKVP